MYQVESYHVVQPKKLNIYLLGAKFNETLKPVHINILMVRNANQPYKV